MTKFFKVVIFQHICIQFEVLNQQVYELIYIYSTFFFWVYCFLLDCGRLGKGSCGCMKKRKCVLLKQKRGCEVYKAEMRIEVFGNLIHLQVNIVMA